MIPPLVPLVLFTEPVFEKMPDPVPILADKIDADTGEFLDLLSSFSVVDGLLTETFRVEAQSGVALEDAGHSMREVKNTEAQDLDDLKGRANAAVKSFVDAGLIKVSKTTVEGEGTDAADMRMYIKDLTIHNAETIPFAPVRQRR